ncbi:uncharacterized protein LOC124913293 [Impatiens glandulifera]|uniref:uncharacterized protein LOC124913293 n=1 Tax=Impatiens glandulifera TaxID=253017 RepID=UPI001FB0880B|nr:uncharacterized protein LOC124913293 [Impatiens glandulifera]
MKGSCSYSAAYSKKMHIFLLRFCTVMRRGRDINVPDRMELGDSKLELLRLDSSRYFGSNTKILGSLFQGADNLKVLDIIGVFGKISDFSLFSSLAKLKMLSLVRLSLDMTANVSFIRHLSCLEVLSLRDSTMKDLPNEISELTNLRSLDLTFCKCFISNGVLSKLTNLQELYMGYSFNDWRLQKEDINGGYNHAAGIDELNCLHKLWRLELEIPNIEQVPRGIRLFSSLTLLDQFKIVIGKRKYERNTQFESGKRQLWLENDRDSMTSFLHELGVLTEKGITNLYISNDLGMWEKMHLNSFLSLREVVINYCGSIITLFPQLQSRISKTGKINGLGHYLKRIEIYECNQMRHLCSTSTSRHLTNLQLLILKGCEMTEEIVNICDEAEQLNKIEFNALETLKLWDLSRLECFCKGINVIYFHKLKSLELIGLKQFIFSTTKLEIPCLEVLKILSIPNIETLCNLVSFPCLNRLVINGLAKINYIVGLKEGEGHHQHHDKIFPLLRNLILFDLGNLIHMYEINHPGLGVLLFQNLTELRIRGCGKLRYLFSENIGRVAAKHLSMLEICVCPTMEVVMKKEDDDDKVGGGSNSLGNSNFFPLLWRLVLSNLSGLRSVSNVSYTWALPLLKELVVKQCPKLEALSPGYLDSPRLDTLSYNNREEVNVKNTWKGDVNTALRYLFIKKEEEQPILLPYTQEIDEEDEGDDKIEKMLYWQEEKPVDEASKRGNLLFGTVATSVNNTIFFTCLQLKDIIIIISNALCYKKLSTYT